MVQFASAIGMIKTGAYLWVAYVGVQIMALFMLIQGIFLIKRAPEMEASKAIRRLGIWSTALGSFGMVVALGFMFMLIRT